MRDTGQYYLKFCIDVLSKIDGLNESGPLLRVFWQKSNITQLVNKYPLHQMRLTPAELEVEHISEEEEDETMTTVRHHHQPGTRSRENTDDADSGVLSQSSTGIGDRNQITL